MLCWKCGTFQIHKADLESNGEVIIVLKCTVCGESDRFVYRAEMWIHEKVVPMLDLWVDQMVEDSTGLCFEKKDDGWHVRAGKAKERPAEESKPAAGKRFGFLRKSAAPETITEEQPEVIVQDEFEGIDLSLIHTLEDVLDLFPDDFDRAHRLLERANRSRSK